MSLIGDPFVLASLSTFLKRKQQEAQILAKQPETIQVGNVKVAVATAVKALEALKTSKGTSIRPALKSVNSPLLEDDFQDVAEKANKVLNLSTKEAYVHIIECAIKNVPLDEESQKVLEAPIKVTKKPREDANDIENKAFSGAMVALVPSEKDAKRMAVANGLAVDDMHLTLLFLGEASNYTEEDRSRIINELKINHSAVKAEAFAISVFNPHKNNPCLVLGVSGPETAEIHDLVVEALQSESKLPEQHSPWVAHISLTYKMPEGNLDISKYKKSLGPVTFDRLRIAFGGVVTDIPLEGGSNE